MWVWLDRLVGAWLDAALAVVLLSSLVALVMVGCRQPARRCAWLGWRSSVFSHAGR